MRRRGDTLICCSDPTWYDLESRGVKPCTVRILSQDEWCEADIPHVKHIRVHRGSDTGPCFTRDILFAGALGELLGKVVLLVCWQDDVTTRYLKR